MALTNYVIGTSAHAGGTWTIQNTNTAQVGRYHDLAWLTEGAADSNGFTTSRPGCLPGPADDDSNIPNCWTQTPTGTGLNLNVRRGSAVVERGTLVGSYIVESNATATVTLATANATNPRIDRVDLQVLDGALGDNGGTSQTALIVSSGTAAGSPSVPAAPSNSIPICQILLPANTTTLTSGMVTDKRRSAGLRGGTRVLLPGDSLTDVGFMPGEMRDTRAIASPGTIDTWDNASAAWVRVHDFAGAAVHFTHFAATDTVTNVTTTSYVAVTDTGGTHLGHNFVAPASGIIELTWGANAFSGVSGSSLLIGSNVRQGGTVGSGTGQSTVSDDDAAVYSLLGDVPGTRMRVVTGLTPGNTYNVQLEAKNSGSTTSHIDRPWIVSRPVDH